MKININLEQNSIEFVYPVLYKITTVDIDYCNNMARQMVNVIFAHLQPEVAIQIKNEDIKIDYVPHYPQVPQLPFIPIPYAPPQSPYTPFNPPWTITCSTTNTTDGKN